MNKKPWMTVLRLAVLAMMTALVFVSNYFRIIVPLSTGQTAFTLANILCCLSGLLLGPHRRAGRRAGLRPVRPDQPPVRLGVLAHLPHQGGHGPGGRAGDALRPEAQPGRLCPAAS